MRGQFLKGVNKLLMILGFVAVSPVFASVQDTSSVAVNCRIKESDSSVRFGLISGLLKSELREPISLHLSVANNGQVEFYRFSQFEEIERADKKTDRKFIFQSLSDASRQIVFRELLTVAYGFEVTRHLMEFQLFNSSGQTILDRRNCEFILPFRDQLDLVQPKP